MEFWDEREFTFSLNEKKILAKVIDYNSLFNILTHPNIKRIPN